MNNEAQHGLPGVIVHRGQAARPGSFIIVVLAFGLLLAGCESTKDIIDAVNPANLFKDGGDAENEEAKADSLPGADDPYPAIGSVPEAPETPVISLDGDDLREELVADKQNARYTDQVIRYAELPSRITAAPQAVETLAKSPVEPPSVAVENGQTVVERSPEPEPQPLKPVAVAVALPPIPEAVQEPAAIQRVEPLVRRVEIPQPAPPPEPIAVNSSAVVQVEPPPPSAADIAREQVASPGAVEKPPPGQLQLVATIYFPGGGARLTDADRSVVAQVMDLFRAGAGRIRIVGHASQSGVTDPSRRNLVNYKSSLDRATAVTKEFLVRGVLQRQIELSAVGARQPRYSEETEAGIAGNQRTEIFLRY